MAANVIIKSDERRRQEAAVPAIIPPVRTGSMRKKSTPG